MAGLFDSMDLSIVKVPLGFIRILELPFAILAFATTSGYSSCAKYTLTNCSDKNFQVCWSYPFSLHTENLMNCEGSIGVFSSEDVSGQSQFYVATGVLSFLYLIGILYIYICQLRLYENDAKLPMIDLAVTGLLTLFWFIGSCAWASGVSLLKDATSKDHIASALKGACGKDKECFTGGWNYASLDISLIVGFACVVIWGINCWFILKETAFWKQRQAGQMPQGGAPATGAYGGTPSTPGAYPGAGHPTQPFPS